MSARVILTASAYKAAEKRQSKAGKPYYLVTLREKLGDGWRYWKAICFSTTIGDELLTFKEGEPLAICGDIDAEIFKPECGEPRLSWKITVDGVLSARAKPKPSKTPRSAPEKAAGRGFGDASNVGGPNDDLPF